MAKQLEIAHPLGKAQHGKFNIIAKFYARPDRQAVIRAARAKQLAGADKVTEDLIKYDFERKKHAFPLMQKAFEKGQRVKFSKGKLIIEGKEVPVPQPHNTE